MISQQHFVEFLSELQQVARILPRSEASLAAQGDLILDLFLRHTPHRQGAVFLREHRNPHLGLAACSPLLTAPEVIDSPLPDEVLDRLLHPTEFARLVLVDHIRPLPDILVPLRSGRDYFGLLALHRHNGVAVSGDDLHFIGAMSGYLAAIMHAQRMATEVREGEFQLKYRLWELESLYDIGLSIASTLDLDRLAEEILIRTISLLNARRAALYLQKEGRFTLYRSFGDVRSEFLENELEETLARQLIEEGVPVRLDAGADCIFPSCESFVALPIKSNDKVIGVLAAADRELRDGGVGAFEENDLRVLSLFANQVAIALENTRLHQEALESQAMQREIDLAVTIQRDILPRALPQLDGYEIEAFARPARQLGGDYYAFFDREGSLSLCVADVSGKSVAAAILVSAFHAAVQLLFREGRDLGDIASELNRHIHLWSAENKFITLILATIDPESEVIRFVNAGHNPAYIVRPDSMEQLPAHGIPVGLLPGSRYKTQARPFPLGSLFVGYSDGITEAENETDEEFGNQRLEEILQRYADGSCTAIRNAIVDAVGHFVGAASQKDDETLVLVRTLPRL